MKKKYPILYLVFFILFFANTLLYAQKKKLSYAHPIEFSPKKYVCYQTSTPLQIDGKGNELAWKNAPWTTDFVDIEGKLKPLPHLSTRVKMLWDENYFYFFAKMEEPHIWAKLTARDAVMFYDDDFEIFLDPDGDSHNYYELEINAFNALWDLILLRPYRVDHQPKVLNEWNISKIKTAIHIEGTINDPSDKDEFWSVEFAIPWTTLQEFAPRKNAPHTGDQWRVNFSRVDWTMEVVDDKYKKVKDPKTNRPLPADNWVWSPQGRINMHAPEMWGYVQFSDKIAGTEKEEFVEQPDEIIKWKLWNLYFQQLQFYKKNKTFTDNLSLFTIPKLKNTSCIFQPKIYTTPHLFEIIAPSCHRDGHWSIRRDGKIDFFKN